MNRRAIHSAYAVSLLVLVAGGLSALVYNFMVNSSNVLSSNVQYSINSASLTSIQSGTLTWYDVTLQNIGSKPFVQTNVSVIINGMTYNLPQNDTTLNPGTIMEQKGVLNAASAYGGSYTVRVSAIANDGSTFVTSRQVVGS
jgi:FlaG/FlaF family flagellin (archaellin)